VSSTEDERRRVYTAAEFMVAVEAGEAVDFEIAHGYMLRSDIRPPDFLQKRLENMFNAERAIAEREGPTDPAGR
jgi:hypothetical protein